MSPHLCFCKASLVFSVAMVRDLSLGRNVFPGESKVLKACGEGHMLKVSKKTGIHSTLYPNLSNRNANMQPVFYFLELV